MDGIKGILIVSGRVLNMAVTGDWSYSPNFFDIVGKDKLYSISKDKVKDAYSKAWKFVNSVKYVFTMEDEWRVFHEFFSILDKELPELDMKEKISKLTDDMVLNFDKYKFYDDVYEAIPKLSAKYKLAIVSDAWPSLREVYKKVSLDKYFSEMIISTEVGSCKPNKKMYELALDSLLLKPNEVIFVDDNPKNCDAAEALGIKSIILDRDINGRIYDKDVLKTNHIIVKDLNELKEVIL